MNIIKMTWGWGIWGEILTAKLVCRCMDDSIVNLCIKRVISCDLEVQKASAAAQLTKYTDKAAKILAKNSEDN